MLRNLLYTLARGLGDANALVRVNPQRLQRKKIGTSFFSLLERMLR